MMIDFPRWKSILVVLVLVWGILFALPNFLSNAQRADLPSWMPQKSMNLGLDLRGGSHLLLEVQTKSVLQEQLQNMVADLRKSFNEAKIPYQKLTLQQNQIVFVAQPGVSYDQIRNVIRDVSRDFVIDEIETPNGYALRWSETAIEEQTKHTLEQSIEIVRRRIDETGTNEPLIIRQGTDRILVQLPGVDDPQRIKNLLGQTAKLTFHKVTNYKMQGEASFQRSSPSTMVLPSLDRPGVSYELERFPTLTGEMLVDARPSFQNGQPVVSFTLNQMGARRFGDFTRENVGRPFAIVLDGQVISAPNVNEPIPGGSAIISGSFTDQEAQDLALLLRAGALPAPLKVLEERSVGPSLGHDSIAAGSEASIYGFALIVIFMGLAYARFGWYANVALVMNLVLMVALLSALQATLTLPGIAGIALTMGMAVDANVLVFERIREELRAGKPLVKSIEEGYGNALSTILDSNITTLIAAAVLFSYGSGPIRGFAVTLGLGILTSLFSALLMTRWMISLWFKWFKPKSLAI